MDEDGRLPQPKPAVAACADGDARWHEAYHRHMNRTTFALIVIVLLATGAVTYLVLNAGETGAPPTGSSLVEYANDAPGISFSYPEGYTLTEAERGNGERRLYVISLVRTADLPPPVNGEGPPSIELAFYQNDLDRQTVRRWIENDSRSNFKLSDGATSEVTVDGRGAVAYRWSGLYEGVTTVFLHKDSVVTASGTYLSPDDEIRETYRTVLDSMELDRDDLIVADAPAPNALAASPLTISGRARGFWYFEASFPARLLDGNGKELGVVPVQAQGEWMTTEFVPFSTVLSFVTPTTATGTLLLEKDNPSGLLEHADELRIPVRFRP